MEKITGIDVSIILVHYNTTKLLLDAIESVLKKTQGVDFEIIVVDNASFESPGNFLHEKFGKNIIYIPLSENLGFGKANNEAIKIARGRNIFFLNPDTLLITNSVKILCDYLDFNPMVGACGGNLYDINRKPVYSYHRPIPGIVSEELAVLTVGVSCRFIFQPFHNRTLSPLIVGNVSGANMMVPRRVLDEVGYFDPDFFMYSEETELSWRIRKAGYKIMNVPQSKIIHLEGQSFDASETRIRMMLESRAKYYRKTRGTFYLHIANVLLWIGIIVNIIVWRVIGKKQKVKNYVLKWKLINQMYFLGRN